MYRTANEPPVTRGRELRGLSLNPRLSFCRVNTTDLQELSISRVFVGTSSRKSQYEEIGKKTRTGQQKGYFVCRGLKTLSKKE